MVINLPVGNNLQDHPMCALEYHIEKPLGINVSDALHNSSNKDYQQFMYFTRGTFMVFIIFNLSKILYYAHSSAEIIF